MKNNKGFTVLMVMFITALVLLTFSFWMFSRRGVIQQTEQPLTTDEQVMPELLEWAGFSNTALGINFQYPKNVFVSPQVKEVPTGSVTRVFLGTANMGTFSVAVINRQFDSRNIIDPGSGRVDNASAINAAGTVGYQYEITEEGCRSRVIQFPHSSRIAMFSFSSCDFDQEPRLAEDDGLMLQILGSVKLSTIVSPPQQEESMDTLPPQ